VDRLARLAVKENRPTGLGATVEGMRILVTGATGYIGGRLVGDLLEAGHDVRAMSRTAGWLRDVPWADQVEIVAADASDRDGLTEAMAGIEVAYFLIHSIGSGAEFADRDRRVAENFAAAAEQAGVRRIVYLGGLGDANSGGVSRHLASRAEVGKILLNSAVPTILVAAASLDEQLNRTFDIGGPDVLTYEDMMQRYAAVAGLRRRLILRVPVLTPKLSSHWVGLVTPVPASLAKPLVESLGTEVICGEHDIADYVPDPPAGLIGFERAVELALAKIREAKVATRWSESEWPGAPSDPLPTDPDWAGGSLYTDVRERRVHAESKDLWAVLEAIGGEKGWYSFPLAWRVRGWLDRLVGGVGLRRGRRDPARLRVGDALDFWRVEEVTRGELLRLRAEMKLPGLAWLEFTIRADPDGPTLVQKATFHPRGLLGHAYWRGIAVFHGVVFGGMIRNIGRAAEAAVPA
jgi:uncharacterized protein YbjT (DUF2867 family)